MNSVSPPVDSSARVISLLHSFPSFYRVQIFSATFPFYSQLTDFVKLMEYCICACVCVKTTQPLCVKSKYGAWNVISEVHLMFPNILGALSFHQSTSIIMISLKPFVFIVFDVYHVRMKMWFQINKGSRPIIHKSAPCIQPVFFFFFKHSLVWFSERFVSIFLLQEDQYNRF